MWWRRERSGSQSAGRARRHTHPRSATHPAPTHPASGQPRCRRLCCGKPHRLLLGEAARQLHSLTRQPRCRPSRRASGRPRPSPLGAKPLPWRLWLKPCRVWASRLGGWAPLAATAPRQPPLLGASAPTPASVGECSEGLLVMTGRERRHRQRTHLALQFSPLAAQSTRPRPTTVR
jgi:hypothetical protein